MKLINFHKFKLFNSIRNKMGIPQDYKAKFDNNVSFKKLDLSKAETEIIERGRGLDVNIEEIEIGEENTLEYKGKKVVVYIRDQYSYKSEYKFHVSWCDTICNMRDNGRLNRYVVSRRKDGTFFVNMIDKGTHKIIEENKISELKICKNCLKKLNYKEYCKFNWEQKTNIYENFVLREFFDKYDEQFKQLPKHTDITAPLNEYPENWSGISTEYREYKKWICEKCNKDFSMKRNLLDVHHMDGNKYNTNYSNLKALCKSCHGDEFLHGHYKKLNKNRYL